MDLPIIARHTSAFTFSVTKKKIFKGTRNREPLALQYRDMLAYSPIKKMATLTNDSKIRALVSSELKKMENCLFICL